MSDIHTIYKTATQQINDALDRRNSESLTDAWDAQTTGMDALGDIYDATDNANTRAQIRRLIGELDFMDIQGDMAEAPRMFGNVGGVDGFYDAEDITHSKFMGD